MEAVLAEPRQTDVAPDGASIEPDGTTQQTLPWLVRLRWAALISEALIVAVAASRGWLPALAPALTPLAVGAASNAVLMIGGRSPAVAGSKTLLGGVLLLDVLLLTATLMFTGGPANPFSVVYLVYVTLGAVMLGAGWTWLIVAAAVSGYASLFVWHVPLPENVAHASGLPSHLAGMWLAFGASAALIAYFVRGVTRTLVTRERELAELRQVAARHERLASLTTLAAGAAHELATPLASIAVAARELELAAASHDTAALADDARLIRSQVERCRVILDQMSGRASREWLEAPASIDIAGVEHLLRDKLPPHRAGRLLVDGHASGAMTTSPSGLTQALLNLATNAFDASEDGAAVTLQVASQGDRVRFTVLDRGPGMTTDVLARAGEPFFTTKAPGAGYGLGLFLARLFAERCGGSLVIDSQPGVGTSARLDLPRVLPR